LLFGGDILIALKSHVSTLEPELMTLDTATEAVRFFSQVEHLAAAGKALCARRCAEQGAHRSGGHRNPAEWLSSLTNDPVEQSIGALETAASVTAGARWVARFLHQRLRRPAIHALMKLGSVVPGPDVSD